jgi:hypothetical protein
MAERIEIISITTPAGTASSAPLVTALPWREGYPVRIEIRVPPGPSGLLGFQLAHSGEVIIPKDKTQFLITDNEAIMWPLDNYPYNAKYTVRTYNTDVFDHTIQIRMLLNELGVQSLTPVPIPAFTPPWQAVPGG